MQRFDEIVGVVNGRPPWDEALLVALRASEARLELARQEYAKLQLENRKLRKSLYEARRRLALWKEREKAWTRTRKALEQRGVDGY